MDKDQIIAGKNKIISRYGAWTSHDIYLGQGISTLNKNTKGFDNGSRGYLQLLKHYGYTDLTDCRILDLGCLEGVYTIELAQLGAKTVGIEGRKKNFVKAVFARDVLGLENCALHLDDVRNLTRAKYGMFDLVIASGILYHLDMPDVVQLLEAIASVLQGAVIVDTHIALENLHDNPHNLSPLEERKYKNVAYRGRCYPEHSVSDSEGAKANRLWASIGNVESFWLTKASVYTAFVSSGFTTVSQYLWSANQCTAVNDRCTFVGIKA